MKTFHNDFCVELTPRLTDHPNMPSKAAVVMAAILSAMTLTGHRSKCAIIAADSLRGEPRDFSDFFSMPIHHPFIAKMEFEFVTRRLVEEVLFGKPAPVPPMCPMPAPQKPALRAVVHRTVRESKFVRITFLAESEYVSEIQLVPANKHFNASSQFETRLWMEQMLQGNPIRTNKFNKVIQPEQERR